MQKFFNTYHQKNAQPKEPKVEKLIREIENIKFSEEEIVNFHPLPSSCTFEDDMSEDIPNPLRMLKECIQENLAIKALASSFNQKIDEILHLLSGCEERVIRMRFGIGMSSDHTWEEIAQMFTTTKEHVEQIASKALKKLKYWS